MDSSTLLFDLLAGGLIGLLGQGIRVVVGLSKMQAAGEPLAVDRLLLSLLIGFIAGGLGVVALREMGTFTFDARTIGEVLAGGYAGADFIEGFITSRLPGVAGKGAMSDSAPPASLASTPGGSNPGT